MKTRCKIDWMTLLGQPYCKPEIAEFLGAFGEEPNMSAEENCANCDFLKSGFSLDLTPAGVISRVNFTVEADEGESSFCQLPLPLGLKRGMTYAGVCRVLGDSANPIRFGEPPWEVWRDDEKIPPEKIPYLAIWPCPFFTLIATFSGPLLRLMGLSLWDILMTVENEDQKNA